MHGIIFILGCKELIAVTGHKPLLWILNNTEIKGFPNPRLWSLKEKTLKYEFSSQYCLDKWQQGSDTVSQYPCNDSTSFLKCICSDTSNNDHAEQYSIEADFNYPLSKKWQTKYSYCEHLCGFY